MAVTVRNATPEDAALLTSLEAASFSEPWSLGAVASHLFSPHGFTRIAVLEDGTAVGYIFGLLLGEEAELLRVAVLPEHRLLGIGFWLVDALLLHMAGVGATTCFLEVRESNRAARHLYESHGFYEVGVRKNYYKKPTENAVLLRYDRKKRVPS